MSTLSANIKCGNSLISPNDDNISPTDSKGASPLVEANEYNAAEDRGTEDKGASPLATHPHVDTSPTDSKGACPLVNATGNKAFDWRKEFPQVFHKKRKKAWHIVTATHDSRTSQRMIEHEVREKRYNGTMPEVHPVILSQEEELLVCQIIDDIIKEDNLSIIAFNICQDHFHMLLVCEEEEIDRIVGKIKSKTAIAINKFRDADGTKTMGQAPLLSRAVWTQKYGCKEVTTEEHIEQVIDYIQDNRIKHDLPPLPSRCDNNSIIANPPTTNSKGACPLVDANEVDANGVDAANNKGASPLAMVKTVSFDEAFRDEYFGGFDVVIGNPPYVRADSPGNSLDFRNYMTSCGKWETLAGKWDLYIPFLELGTKLTKPHGLCSFIIPDAYCHAEYGKQSLEYMKSHRYLSMVDYFPDINVFEGVGVKSIIVHFDRKGAKDFVQRIHNSNHEFTERQHPDYPDNLRIDAKESIIGRKEGLIPLGNICYITKGIVGNSDEKQYKGEFEVGDLLSEIKDESHPKLYFEGKDIGRWGLMRKRYIEYGTERSPSKWSRKGFTEMFEGSPKLVTMRSPGTFPRTFLDTENGYFNESAIGFKRWIDLKGVNNNSVSKSYNDEEERGSFEEFSINYSYKALMALFNSSLIRHELNTERRSNIHIYPDDWKRIKLPLLTSHQPIARGLAPLSEPSQIARGLAPLSEPSQIARGLAPLSMPTESEPQTTRVDEISTRGQAPLLLELETLVDSMLSMNKELQEKRSRFLRRLTENMEGVKITTALQTFDKLTFAEFLAELKKQKIKLSLSQQDEWEEYFNQHKEACQTLSLQISETDNEIDTRVFDLYGLTEEERKVVMGT